MKKKSVEVHGEIEKKNSIAEDINTYLSIITKVKNQQEYRIEQHCKLS